MTDIDGYAAQWSEGPVLASSEGGVLTLTLNRPSRKNAMTMEGWEAIFHILRRGATDEEVRVVVITGAGGDFCAGADIASAPTGHPLGRVLHISKTAQLLHDFPKPIVAKVEGVAVGAGWNLARYRTTTRDGLRGHPRPTTRARVARESSSQSVTSSFSRETT